MLFHATISIRPITRNVEYKKREKYSEHLLSLLDWSFEQYRLLKTFVVKAKFHYAIWFEPAPNQLRTR